MKSFAFSFLVFASSAFALDPSGGLKFSFGSSTRPGFQKVAAGEGSAEYGYVSGSEPSDAASAEGVISERPFEFFVNLPEGNYRVKLKVPGGEEGTSTTIKAESRRLQMEKIDVGEGQTSTVEFAVNVRQPNLPGGGTVSLNSREVGPPAMARWDDRLTLEFNGKRPAVSELEIVPSPKVTTVFIAGDSTVAEQAREPWAGWGQMLPAFFGPDVAVANHAESGLALYSFRKQKRLEKILSALKRGDYVFVQFGHNDQKDKSPKAGPFTTYKDNLKNYVADIKAEGGIPVLVTPMERRRWKGNEIGSTLGDYAEAVRQVAKEDQVSLVDLNAMSLQLYGALGPELSKKAFVHFPPNSFPGQAEALKDDTHHCNFGAYELARCMVSGIREKVPGLAAHLRKDVSAFDPAKPDDPALFAVPASPSAPLEKPAGG